MNNWLLSLKKYFADKTGQWFIARMPRADRVILSQRSTYIFPTKAGFLLMAVLFIMLLGATNYQNNLAFMLTFLITGIGLVSIIYTYKNLQGLCFQREATASVFAGESLEIFLRVDRESRQPASFVSVGFKDQSCSYFDYDGNNAARIALSVSAEQRGWFQLPKIKVSSEFPFGLLRVWSWFTFDTAVLVYPKPIEPPAIGSENHQASDDESNPVKGNDELYGVRKYQPGDPLSRIDWKSYAREQGLNTRDFVSYQHKSLCFDWQDYYGFDYESVLSYLCWLVVDAAGKDIPFALNLQNVQIPLDNGGAHFEKCLRALALSQLPQSSDVAQKSTLKAEPVDG